MFWVAHIGDVVLHHAVKIVSVFELPQGEH